MLSLDFKLAIVRELKHCLARDHSLGAIHVVRAEEELPVEVGVVDRVKIDHRDVLESREHKVLH